MHLLKIIGKVIAFPVVLIVTLIQWLFVFLVSFSSIVFYLLAGLLFLIAALSIIFGVATWQEALRPTLVGFVVFMVPVIGQTITEIIGLLKESLCDFIWS